MRTLWGLWLLLLSCGAYAADLPADITSNMTLTTAQSPYWMRSSVNIAMGVTVTVQAGVEIIAVSDYQLNVYGTLIATGTASAPVLIRSIHDNMAGAWRGIFVAPTGSLQGTRVTIKNGIYNIMSAGGALTLSSCTLALASGDALYAWGPTTLNCTNCTFRDNTERGLYLEGYQLTGSVSNCRFEGNGSYPVQLKATLAEILGAGNVYSNNAQQRIGVSCSMVDDIVDQDTWTKQAVPYELGVGGGDRVLKIAAGGALTISPGTVIYGPGTIACYGSFSAPANLTTGSLFTAPPERQQPGQGVNLEFYPNSNGTLAYASLAYGATGVTVWDAATSLQNCLIENCLYDGVRYISGQATTFTNNIIRNCGRYGLLLEGAWTSGSIIRCRFIRNGDYPVWIMASQMHRLSLGNVYQDNGRQRIGVSCAAHPDIAGASRTWRSQGIPLDCTAGGLYSLSVAANAELILEGDQTLYLTGLEVYGRLTVNGCLATPCNFLPPPGNTAAGSWDGIRFMAGASGTVYGAVIQYATTGLSLLNASPNIVETKIRNCLYEGLSCAGRSTPRVRRCVITNNSRYGVYVTDTSAPDLGNLAQGQPAGEGRNVLRDNSSFDVYNNTSNTIQAQYNTWVSTDPTVIGKRIYDRSDNASRGPVVFQPLPPTGTGQAPVLKWLGTSDYKNGGVSPTLSGPGQVYSFRVIYQDADNDPPASILLYVSRGDTPIVGSPFALQRLTGSYATGAQFGRDLYLSAGTNYRYWFSARDSAQAATGAPTSPQNGPIVTTAPSLGYASLTGYSNENDGVEPDQGPAGTTFTFCCRYRDADNDPPAFVRCHILLAGTPISGSPFSMTAMDSNSFSSGRNYKMARVLSAAGTYTYWFEASDGFRTTTFPATGSFTGPQVTGTAAALLGVCAQQVNADHIRIQWWLSAPARVRLRIFNLAGRCVATVGEEHTCAAGENTAVWLRRLHSGVRAPAGRYQVLLEAFAEDGTHRQLTAPLILR